MGAVKTAKKQGFRPGQSGNPSGRPKGAKNKQTIALESLLHGQAKKITQKCVDKALEGDTTAIRICMERILPVRKGAPVNFELPSLQAPGDIVGVYEDVLKAVAQGQLTPDEGISITSMLENKRKAIETAILEERIAKLEAQSEPFN